jgi:predicted Zn finger-like uncharacterized protein
MFTRCPACRTVFHITAAELRAAEGTVVCGACGTTFDALESLSEAPPRETPAREAESETRQEREPEPEPEHEHESEPKPEPELEPEPEPEPEPGNPPPPNPAAAPGSRIAETPELAAESFPGAGADARDENEFLEELESLIGDEEPVPGEAPAYMGPWDPGTTEDWRDDPGPAVVDHRLSDEEPPSGDEAEEDLPPMAAAAHPLRDDELAAGISTTPAGPGVDAPEDEFDDDLPDPDSVFRVDDAGELDDAEELDDTEEFDDTDELDDAEELDEESTPHYLGEDDDEEQDDDARPRVMGTRRGGDPIDHRIASDPDHADSGDDDAGPTIRDTDTDANSDSDSDSDTDSDTTENVPEFARETRGRRTWVRILLVMVAIAVLAITWAHAQHGKLLRHPTGAAVLGPVYELLGMDVAPDWNPADYRAVQWEAVATADQPGTLTVAVDFLNAANYAQPYPIIRIVLEDRFGRRVGTHDVAPAQYLQDHSPASRLPAGRRARTTVSVPDPGARADGFRVDFCLELRTRGLVCGPEPFR